MELFDIFSRYFWLFALGTTAVNYPIMRSRLSRLDLDSQERDTYELLLRNYFTWSNLPWIVMAAGSIVGHVPSVWHYFRPQDNNPWVLAWFASIFLLWFLCSYWLFLRGGAELLARRPQVFNLAATSPALVKVYWLVCLGGGVLGMVLMYTMNAPAPTLP